MLTYEAKIFVKDSMNRDDCITLFEHWLQNSPNYSCDNLKIPRQSTQDFLYDNDKVKLEVKTYQDDNTSVTACMFTNIDKTGAWKVSVILVKEKKQNYVLVQQEYEGGETIKSFHRPYIVKLLSDFGWVDTDQYLEFFQDSFQENGRHFYTVQEQDVDVIAGLLTGEIRANLPIVYISYDCRQKKYHMSLKQIEKLAIDLLGTAYVIVDPQDTALVDQISLKSKTLKVFRGYLGIYFPDVADYIICSARRKNLLDYIKKEVWQISLSQKTISGITWKVLVAVLEDSQLLEIGHSELQKYSAILHHKKNQLEFYRQFEKEPSLLIHRPSTNNQEADDLEYQEKSRNLIIRLLREGKKKYKPDSRGEEIIHALLKVNKESSFFADEGRWDCGIDKIDVKKPDESFDIIAAELDEKINKAKLEIAKCDAQLSKFETNHGKYTKLIVRPNEIQEFGEGEINDLIVICLEEALKIKDGEEKAFIEAILAKNSQLGIVARKMDAIKALIEKSTQITPAVIKALENEGCTFITKGGSSHPKGYFHEEKYNFILSCTPSDYRSTQNTASDFLNKISIY